LNSAISITKVVKNVRKCNIYKKIIDFDEFLRLREFCVILTEL